MVEEDEIICRERIKPRKLTKSQNIIHRLRDREHFGNKTEIAYQEFFQCIGINLTVANIEKPACYLRKFSPCGKFLIAFSSDQSSLEIYEFKGADAAGDLIGENWTDEVVPNINRENGKAYEIRSKIFDKLFKLKHVVNMDGSEKQLNRECSLFCNDGKHVIIGAAILISDDQRPHFYELYTNNEFISTTANCPLEDYTLYIIDLIEGRITDSIEFKNDKIILSHNQGIYLYNDTLAVLSIQHQTIHVYHILEGSFMLVRQIGRFCCDEEQFLYSSTSGNNSRAFREPTINSLKHRILVHLFNQAKARYNEGDRVALRKFYQNFDQFLGLRMWKMQLLDEDHLLIKYSDEAVVTLKVHEPNSHISFFVIYNIWEKKILAVHSNISDELLYLFENFTDNFRNSKLSFNSQWTCSPSNNIYANLLHQRFKQTIISAKGGGSIESIKRINAQLPISAQSYSSSPYLDLSLFSYDDKWVSIMERPKAASEFPIRFFARDSGLLRFRIHAVQKQGLPGRRLVAFCFHPSQPFAISVQRINTDYIVNFHLWNSNVRVK